MSSSYKRFQKHPYTIKHEIKLKDFIKMVYRRNTNGYLPKIVAPRIEMSNNLVNIFAVLSISPLSGYYLSSTHVQCQDSFWRVVPKNELFQTGVSTMM